jgi:uncharacterized protein YjiS (DUF1127 family)
MLLNLDTNGTLRLAGARGTTVSVLDGRVWITEAGRRVDAFLARGASYDVAGDGVVVIGAEARARLDLRRSRRGWLARWLQARGNEAELAALSDHTLRDIGLRRDEIYSFFRR